MAIGGPYRAILARPGAASFSISGLISRFPMAMVGIGIVLMVEGISGSYALAGRVSAIYVLAQAVCGPQIARLIDQHGQAKIMRPLLAIAATGISGLIIAAVLGAPDWALYATAAFGGSTIGSMGTLVRARWSKILDNPHDVHTAYSLESALDEVVFVLGPVLATWLATSVAPWSGLVFPVVAMLVGGYWFLSQKETEPVPTAQARTQKPPTVLRHPSMVLLVLVFVALGGVFGASDVATIAFAEEHGNKAAAGVVLAVFAAGSLIAGLWYGARRWVSPLWVRFTVTMLGLAVGVAMFPLVSSLFWLSVVMFVSGLMIAPSLIGGNGLVQLIVPQAQLTEGLTYVGTALGVGVSFGSSLAGARIDAAGAHAGFLVAIIAAGIGAVLVAGSAPVLRRASTTSRGDAV